jgi:hypothetical protein
MASARASFNLRPAATTLFCLAVSLVMAKSSKKIQTKSDIELVPDAWPRFENFIKEIVKAGPQHRVTPKIRKQKAKKKA